MHAPAENAETKILYLKGIMKPLKDFYGGVPANHRHSMKSPIIFYVVQLFWLGFFVNLIQAKAS